MGNIFRYIPVNLNLVNNNRFPFQNQWQRICIVQLYSNKPCQFDFSEDICDPAIEEHFRRSLGAHYPNFMTKEVTSHPEPSRVVSPSSKSSSTSPPSAAHQAPSSSVSPSSLSPRSGKKLHIKPMFRHYF